MLNNEQSAALEQPKRIMLIIFGALIFGVLFFAIIAAISHLTGGKPLFNTEFGFMAIFGIAFAVLALLPSMVVPIFIRKAAVKEISSEFSGKLETPEAALKAMVGLQTAMIIGLALLEGAAFFNLVVDMTEGSLWSLLVAAGLVLIMFIRIPLPGRIEDQISNILDDARMENKQ